MSEEVFEVPEGTEYRYLVQEEEEEVQFSRRRYVSPFLVLSRQCIALICAGVVALLVLAGYLAYVAQTRPSRQWVVSTECGALRGSWRSGAYSFKGIPYAAPPVGERRWRPPVDLQGAGLCWAGMRDATRYGSVCAQVRPLEETGQVMGQEDCLFLNVWTPTLRPSARLPVMLWLHGGYLHIMSGGEEGYCPTEELAAQTGVVYVSMNYRLNALGFLALELLRDGSPTNTSGNYGFMDQIAALQWVRRNIRAFGGDPEKVTIFGQNSGGTSVWTLMMSPLAKGLFRGAIDMSGSYIYNASLEKAESSNKQFLQRANCTDLPCLRALSTNQILQAIPWRENPSWAAEGLTDLPEVGHFVGPVAVVDGHVLAAPPLETWGKGGGHNDVPFVIGTTEQETDFSPPSPNISQWTWEDYRWFVTEKLSPFGENLPAQALALYPSSAQCPTQTRCPERMYTTVVSDLRATCPNNELARRAAAALRSPVYRYVVTHTPSSEAKVSDLLPFPSRFSFHLLDSLAFFRGLEGALGYLSPQDRAFQDLITHHFLHFAKEGKMSNEWPQYPTGTALLSHNLSVVQNYSAQRCQFWEKNGFYPYAWVN